MRKPEAWNDTSLLQDEPFKSWFETRYVCRQRHDQDKWEGSLAKKLCKDASGAVSAWIKLAFQHLPGDGHDAVPVDFDEGSRLFAKVYWLIYLNQCDEAYLAVRSARRQRGFRYNVSESVPCRTLGGEQETSSGSGLLKRRRGYERQKSRSKSVSAACPGDKQLDGQKSGSLFSARRPAAAELPQGTAVDALAHLIDLPPGGGPARSAPASSNSTDTDNLHGRESNHDAEYDSSLTSLTSSEESDDEAARALESGPSARSRPRRAATNTVMIAEMARKDFEYSRRETSLSLEDVQVASSPTLLSSPRNKKRKRPRLSQADHRSSHGESDEDLEKKMPQKESRRRVNRPPVEVPSSTALVFPSSDNPTATRITGSQKRHASRRTAVKLVKKTGVSKDASAKKARKVYEKKMSAQECRLPRLLAANGDAGRHASGSQAAGTSGPAMREVPAGRTVTVPQSDPAHPGDLYEQTDSARGRQNVRRTSDRGSQLAQMKQRDHRPIVNGAKVLTAPSPTMPPPPADDGKKAYDASTSVQRAHKYKPKGTEATINDKERVTGSGIGDTVGAVSKVNHRQMKTAVVPNSSDWADGAMGPKGLVSTVSSRDKRRDAAIPKGARKKASLSSPSRGIIGTAPHREGPSHHSTITDPRAAALAKPSRVTSAKDGSLSLRRDDSTPTLAMRGLKPSQYDGSRTMTETLGPSGAPSTPLLEPCHVRRVRPPLPCKPPVWAKHRQEVCESVEWFRSYQGGVYYNRGGAHGYLLSAFSASRDLFHHEGKLIISHGGGRAEAIHSREGKLMAYQAADQQADDKSVRALLSSYEQHRPIVLLIDDKYELFPYDLKASNPDYTYVALGNYLITQVWAERSSPKASMDSVIRYKFAFQWCDEQGEPWWLQNPPKHDSFGHSGLSIGDTGPDTNSGDPLRPDIGTDKLLPQSFIPHLPPFRMKLGRFNDGDVSPFDYESAGITIRSCQCCRRPSPLIYIQGWTCLSPDCPQFWCLADGKTPPEDLDYEKAFLVLLDLPIANCMDIRPLLPRNPGVEGVTTGQEFTRGFHCPKCGRLSCRAKWEYWECFSCGNRYRVEGRIRLPNELWKRMKLGFDQHKVRPGAGIIKPCFAQYVEDKMHGHFQTFILPGGRGRIHHVLGGPLRNKRADDIFRLYQEQAAEGQVSFRRWPIRMHKCRGDLLAQYFSHNAGAPYHYVGGTNETISFDKAPSAVMQALSLIQDRASHVLDRRLTFNEILSAAYMQDQQMAYHGDDEEGLGPIVASLSLGSPALMRFRPKQGKQEVISIILRHGDVIVMEGLEVQQYYEHQVQPVDFRIAATARMIGMEGT